MTATNGVKQEVEKETAFPNILDELLDSSYPLLQKFRGACPGSYKHSQAVASMVEAVSMELGLNTKEMKVAALYHDIGKMFNPDYFSENQPMDSNPHDNIDPILSFQIISRHVADGVNILINDQNFPRRIIEIISQHHGNTTTKYFHLKSKEESPDKFRYNCSKPNCIESAILMITDRVDARSRSGTELTEEELVSEILQEVLDDGQLDEVHTKLGNLKVIKEVLAKELRGSLQKRVNYETVKEIQDPTELSNNKKGK